MTITLSSKEFDEAVSLWLKAQGFTTDRYSISTRVIAGRSDGPLGTRLEVQLDPIVRHDLSAMDIQISTGVSTSPKRFGQGHADE